MALLCKRYEDAEYYLSTACQMEPFDTYYKYHLALTQFHTKKFDACKSCLDSILQSRPNDLKSLNLLCQYYVALKDWKDALQTLKKIEQFSPADTVFVKYEMGVIYEHMKQEKEALQLFQQCIDYWTGKCQKIGFGNYFYHKPQESKALQKIQQRGEAHNYDKDEQWKQLRTSAFQLGMLP